jgi:hypothetical protein
MVLGKCGGVRGRDSDERGGDSEIEIYRYCKRGGKKERKICEWN